MMQRVSMIMAGLALLIGGALGQSAPEPTGSIRGVVFTTEQDQAHLVVPGTKISLDGPLHLEGTSDSQGTFAFSSVPVGSYTITAESPGLTATQNVDVRTASVSAVELEMKVQLVAESATVTASTEAVDTKEPSGTNTVGETAVEKMPNIDEQFQSLLPLVPGVVRGPNGLINMKGAQNSQNGSLVNSADVTDPATGTSAINLPIDVVSSIHVLSTPYNPEYGKFTGAVSNVETRSGGFNKFRVSGQNFLPRLRRIDGSIMGIAAFTPRVTFSGPLVKDRVAFTQSSEYRYERDAVDSLPPLQSYNRSETFNSYTQLDVNISQKQTASASFAIFPQHLDYYGLNTFTPQASTPDLNERGYQGYLQHRYVTGAGDLLTSQISVRKFDADVVPNSSGPYQLLLETTQGGYFNRQNRDTTRTEWEEIFRSHPHHFFGSHELTVGVDFAHSSYDGRQQFLPVQIVGVAGYPLEQIAFGPASTFSVDQNETAWFVGDKWTVSNRLIFDLGLRFDRDSVTDAVNPAPRAGFILALTKDNKTVLKGGAGFFYDRVPLNIPAFPDLPSRTVSALNPVGGVLNSTEYGNVIANGLRNPRSEVWNLEVDREVTSDFLVRVECAKDGSKQFTVISEDGSGSIRKHVFQKLLSEETEASRRGTRTSTRLIPANYDFQIIGKETLETGPAYTLTISPKTPNKYLIDGKIWIDANDYSIVRIEGQPARNPSFWVHSVHFIHTYQKVGQFWFASSTDTTSEIRIFGDSELKIENVDYKLNPSRNSNTATTELESEVRLAQ